MQMEVDREQSEDDGITIRGMDQSRSLVNRAMECRDTRSAKNLKFVLPGEKITDESSYMRGHGTYITGESCLTSSLAGIIEPINKLISVRPVRTRYNGEIGDVVVGRIIEVLQRKWKVETNSRLDSVLQLSSVNLPGGELRRKTTEDELNMRNYFVEGDLISAEVQSVYSDGSLSLHTRSLKYGKLGQGTLVRVSPSLVERQKTHIRSNLCGAHVILGNNGYIWISQMITEEEESGGFAINMDPVALAERQTISRLRNCILCLAQHKIMLYDTSILYCFEASQQQQVKDLLKPEVATEVANLTRRRLELENC